MARRRRRDVNVVDIHVGIVDVGRDSKKLDVIVDDVEVDGGEGDRVVNEEPHPTTTTRAIFPDERIAGDVWIRRIEFQFRFLKSDDADFMFIEKITKFIRFCSNGVAVPLQDDGELRRRRRRRSGVRMDSSNEEEEEDG